MSRRQTPALPRRDDGGCQWHHWDETCEGLGKEQVDVCQVNRFNLALTSIEAGFRFLSTEEAEWLANMLAKRRGYAGWRLSV